MSNFALLQLIAFIACPALILQQWSPAGAANILAVQQSPGRSHWNVMRAVLRALTDRGHMVTVFTSFVDGDRDGYTEVDTSGQIKALVGLNATLLFETFGTTQKLMKNMMRATRSGCDTIYEQPRLVDILDGVAARRFDLVVTERLVSECVAYVATALHVPMLYVVPPPIITYLERSLTGYVPNPAAAGHLLYHRGVPKTFAERLTNAALTVYCSAVTWYAEWQLRRANPRPYDTVELVRPSLIFSNTHFITEPARPLSPEIVQIGGIHLTTPKQLPNDILEFMDDAPHGVIYFTFGSMVSMASLSENVLSSLREALAQVPQKVLWKYEGEMENKPENVMTRKWFPQRDILMHPKLKLFISHGGISGVYEAVDAGVPVLGFSFFYDQPRNIDNLVGAGMAISMDLFSVTKDSVLNSVLAIVNDDRYQKNAKIASERFKDRSMSPAESVVYWTEYVLRHKGAPHLKSHAMNLTWYQYFLVDVTSAFLFVAFVALSIVYCGLKKIYKHNFKYFYTGSIKAKHK